jgi:DNA polymerase-3 subunit delta'
MSWNRVIGQQRVKELLRRALQSGHIAHAYLFYGPEGVGKDAAAIEFARTLNCGRKSDEACDECESCKNIAALRHPNVHMIVALPVGKNEVKGDHPIEVLADDQVEELHEQIRLKAENPYHRIALPKATAIKINSIREIRRQSAMTMFEEGKKVYIISRAEQMNLEASNSLLKTLEEPSPNTVLILTTAQRHQLLPTIVSRCQLVSFDPLEENDIRDSLVNREGVNPASAALIAKLAEGSYTRALELLSNDVQAMRDEVVALLRAALSARPSLVCTEIEKFTVGSDRTAVERSLRMLEVWLREALMVRERGESNNGSSDPDIRRFLDRFPHANLPAALESVESSIALLGKNVYLPLILTNLVFDLKRYTRAEPPL